MAQTTDQKKVILYHGDDAHTIETIPYTKPPFASLEDFLLALNIPLSAESEGRISLSVNHRPLIIDTQTKKARFNQQTSEFHLRRKDNRLFVRVDDLTNVFSNLLGRKMIYEHTSRSIHLPKLKDVQVTIRMRQVRDGYRLVMLYSHPLSAPKIEKTGRQLVVKIPASPVVWDLSGFQTNEAVTRMERYEGLPDKTTEVLFRIGEKAAKYNVEPYSPENPRTVIKVTGSFFEENEASDPSEPLAAGLKRIMIDAGHGGRDQGAKGPSGLLEKDVTLDISKRLEKMLASQGEYEVKLTRKDDTKLSLKTRTAMANQFEADLLVSIHVNAIRSINAKGSETYYLSMDADNSSFDASHYAEYEDPDEPGVVEQEDDLSLILWDMAQAKHREDSFRLARYIQQELNNVAKIRNRGVKQAPLKVLKGATMPAILVEVAFISNPSEEAKLKDSDFRDKIVRGIFTAIRIYDEDLQQQSRRPEEEISERGM